MALLPNIGEEEIRDINAVLHDFLEKSAATAALLTAEGGFLISYQGELRGADVTTLGALASNCFCATQAIARLIEEESFRTIYHQGERSSILMMEVDDSATLIVLFPAAGSVGAVKYYAAPSVQALAELLQRARDRAPDESIDLALLNLSDSVSFFRRKA